MRPLKRLVEDILEEHLALFKKMPAAQAFHHSLYRGPARARLEHDPDRQLPGGPLRQVLRRLESAPEPRGRDRGDDPARHRQAPRAGVPPGRGEVHQGRPADRPYPDRAGTWSARPPLGSRVSRRRRLLLLEHAILAHHGRREFGSPVLPQTLEALLVSLHRRPGRQDEHRRPRADASRRRPTASPTGSSPSTTDGSTRAFRRRCTRRRRRRRPERHPAGRRPAHRRLGVVSRPRG